MLLPMPAVVKNSFVKLLGKVLFYTVAPFGTSEFSISSLLTAICGLMFGGSALAAHNAESEYQRVRDLGGQTHELLNKKFRNERNVSMGGATCRTFDPAAWQQHRCGSRASRCSHTLLSGGCMHCSFSLVGRKKMWRRCVCLGAARRQRMSSSGLVCMCGEATSCPRARTIPFRF